MTLVVDASVAFKWFKQEPGTPEATSLITMADRLIAPDIVIAEVCNAAWRCRRTGSLSDAQYRSVPAMLLGAYHGLHPSSLLADEALRIAVEFDHPAYDCFYLALARYEDAPLITADQRLLARVAHNDLGRLVRPLS